MLYNLCSELTCVTDGARVASASAVAGELHGALVTYASMLTRVRVTPVHHLTCVKYHLSLAAVLLEIKTF